MRNDSEHTREKTEAGQHRGALAGALSHWPRLTVSRKLWLGFGVLLLLLIIGGIVIEHNIRTIDANLKEITEIEEPEQAAAFEMEINVTGTGFAVLGYLHDRDPANLAYIDDAAADFALFQQRYQELTLQAKSESEQELSARIDEGYAQFTSLARDLIALEDMQFEKVGLFRQNLDQMDVVLNEQIQASIGPSDPDSNLKLDAVREMEISVNGIAKELGDYLRTHDTQYAQRAQEYKKDLEHTLTMYESLDLSSQERQWAGDLRSLCTNCVALAQEIIDLDRAEELSVANFVQLRNDLDILFDDGIRAVTRSDLADAKAEAEQSVHFAHWALLGLLIAGLGGGGAAIIIGRGISKPLGELATGVEHISRGDLSHVINVDSSDEIGELAAAFNRMTANLRLITASRDELDGEIEERKQAEKALLESEAKYRTIFENVQDIFYQTDMQGIIVEISPSVERWGYTREGLIGTQVLDIYENPEDRSVLVKTILEHGEILDYELRLKTGDGSVADASVSAHLLRRQDGTAAGIEGVLRDITERKQAEKALQESDERTRAIIETAYDAFISMDANGYITDWNAQAETTFGWSRAEAVGRLVADTIIPPSLRESHQHGLEAFLETGEGPVLNQRIEITALRRDGQEFPVELAIWPAQSGGAYTLNAFVHDITERKRAQEALQESEERFRRVFAESPIGMAIVSLDYRFANVNSSLCEMVGYSEEELTALTFPEITHPADVDKDRELAEQVFAGEIPSYEIEKRYIRKTGETIWVNLNASVVRGQNETPQYGLAMIEDITDRKRMEEALERSLGAERERARRDPLTGVLNHGAIVEELRNLVSSSAEGSSHTVAMVDVDGLKAANDTYGHRVGDAVLTTVAGALSREGAIVGRYGGDEFVVVLREMDRAAAERYRDAVPEALANAGLTDPESGANIPVSVSIGLACYPKEAKSIADLINLADSAMYASRRQRPFEPGSLPKRGPLGSDRAAEMVGALVPLLTSPGDLNDKLRLVSHHLSVGAGYDAVDFSLFAPEPGSPLAQNTFAQAPNDLLDAWHREQRADHTEPHPLRLLFERSPRPVILNDPWNDELLLPRQREILRSAELKSVLVAPLVWQDHVLGSLGVANRQAAAFTPADAQFLMTVATQVSAIARLATLVEELQAASSRLAESHEETVLLLAASAEAHDHTTGIHLQGVRHLAEALALELGYAEADAIALGLASVLHDIGKICVPDAILASPAKLEANQWEIMKQHTIWGADFLEGHPGFELAAIVARHHHEHWDGGGYPEGIAGPAIPEAATIVAVADAFDAITHDRPYRDGRSAGNAVAEIAAYSGKQFNPKVVAALERLGQRNELPIVYAEVSDTETAA